MSKNPMHPLSPKSRRAKRQTEAATRAEQRQTRDKDAQLAVLKNRPGNARREITRLETAKTPDVAPEKETTPKVKKTQPSPRERKQARKANKA